MKKLKIGFGEGGFQGFMARHVEKCVLVLVILLMAWFIYSGVGKSDVTITTDQLKQNASTADAGITSSSFAEVAPERMPRTFPSQVIKLQKNKIDSRGYAYTSWDLPLVPRLTPRLDPKILAAEKVIVTPYYGPLVLAAPQDEDARLPEDPLEKFEVVLGGSGGYPGALSNEGDDDDDDKPKKKREPKATTPTMGPSGYGPSTSGSSKSKAKKGEDPYSAPSMANYGSMMGGGATTRSISNEATMGIKAGMGSIVQPSYAMVITASVPYAKQWEAYREAFKDAPGGQDPTRDVPKYDQVVVYRLDVTGNPAMDPATGEWKRVDAKALKTLEEQYGAFVNELADPEAVDPGLTHPVPPFLLTDLRPVLLHPDVERATNVIPKFEEESTEYTETEDGLLLEDEEEDGEMRGSGYPGFRGGSGMRPPGGSGMRLPAGGSMRPPAGSSMMPRSGMSPPRAGGSGFGGSGGRSQMSSMGGMSGYGGGGMMNLETYRPVSKKLVRFVDYSAEPGHKYRYKVMLALEDPNRPEDPSMDPDPTSLDETVHVRLKTVEAAEAKTGRRRYLVTSAFSEPSAVVSLSSPERYYAGETVPGATVNIGGVAVSIAEPSAKVLAVAWDPKLGVFAPAEQAVHRASVLNVKADVEVVHPVLGDVRKIKEYELSTNGVVLDILGGERVPGTADSKEIIRSPGETLIMDAEGKLLVTDESRDIEGYRKYVFPEPKEEPKPKSEDGEGSPAIGPSVGPMGPMGGSGKGPPSQGYPGGKGGKKARPGR